MDVVPIQILMLILSVVMVALAAAIEIAFAAADRGHVRELAEQGNARAQTAELLLSDPPQFLITTMLLKTAGMVGVGLTVAWLASGGFTMLTMVLIGIALWLAMALVQVIARALTHHNADEVALRLAGLVGLIATILSPMTALMRRTSIIAWHSRKP